MEQTEIKGKKKLPIWAVIVGLVAIIIVLVAVYVSITIAEPKSGSKSELEQRLELADKYINELNYKQAIAIYDMILEIDPQNRIVKTKMADAYIAWAEQEASAGNTERAAEILQEGFDKTADSRIETAISPTDNRSQSQSEPSAEPSSDSTEARSQSDDPGYLEAIAKLKSSDTDEALRILNELKKQNPGDSNIHIALAAVYCSQDDVISALSLLEEGIEKNSEKERLMRAMDYIRENSVLVSALGIIDYEGGGGYEDSDTGWENNYYDENGRLIRSETGDGTVTTYEYDSEGNKTRYEYRYNTGYDISEYKYNDYGDVTVEKYESSYSGTSWTSETYYEYKYDQACRKVHRVATNRSKSSYGEAETVRQTDYEYDAAGNMIRQVESDSSGMAVDEYFEYDANNNLVKNYIISDDVSEQGPRTYKYDARGNIIESQEGFFSTIRTYDLMDNVVTYHFSGVMEYTTTYTNTYHFKGEIDLLINQ